MTCSASTQIVLLKPDIYLLLLYCLKVMIAGAVKIRKVKVIFPYFFEYGCYLNAVITSQIVCLFNHINEFK